MADIVHSCMDGTAAGCDMIPVAVTKPITPFSKTTLPCVALLCVLPTRDSVAVLASGGRAVSLLTVQHAEDQLEAARVTAAGGVLRMRQGKGASGCCRTLLLFLLGSGMPRSPMWQTQGKGLGGSGSVCHLSYQLQLVQANCFKQHVDLGYRADLGTLHRKGYTVPTLLSKVALYNHCNAGCCM